MFRVFVTKQTSNFCGTNCQLSCFDDSVENVCPSCGKEDKSSEHITITRCRYPRRRAMWRTLVQELVLWVGATTPDLVLCDIIERFLTGQGKVAMTDCLELNTSETQKILAHIHDKLGWNDFVEGRTCKFFLEVVAPMFCRRSRMTPERWG